jgi:hypothetical protein
MYVYKLHNREKIAGQTHLKFNNMRGAIHRFSVQPQVTFNPRDQYKENPMKKEKKKALIETMHSSCKNWILMFLLVKAPG